MAAICFVQIDDVSELARLACAFESIPIPIFAMRLNTSILVVNGGVIKDTIIFYYVPEEHNSGFLAYKHALREDVRFTDTAADPTYTYAPIISIKSIPNEWYSSELIDRCEIIILEDLTSLSKLTAYKMIIEEIPATLFYTQGLLGTFISFNNTDTYFYCIEVEEPPYPFVRYSNISAQSSFTNRIEEHGYLYSKIIRLKSKHPLIMV